MLQKDGNCERKLLCAFFGKDLKLRKKLCFSSIVVLFQIQVTHCVCQGDGCNSAPAMMTGASAVAAFATLFNLLAAVIPSNASMP